MLCSTLTLVGVADAENDPARPEYRFLRQDEDWSSLRESALREDIFDRVKFLPLSRDRSSWLTLGGEARERFEYFENANWGLGPQDENGYFLHRFMLHADAHAGENFRLFTQFKSGLEGGREGGPRATDRDDLDIHQVFGDLRARFEESTAFRLRIGRQELMFGSQRLVSVRESPNVRQSFDAVRGTLNWRAWQFDVFAAHPVETEPGIFDDGSNKEVKFWGAYATAPFPLIPGGKADCYYLGIDRDLARFAQGTAQERRHSLGTRLWGEHADWDWNFEFVYQFGEFGEGDISAWTAASDTGFTLSDFPWTPRVGFKADITSGDRDPGDSDLQTFNALFPKGAYFSENGLIGPANHMDLHPSIELHPSGSITFTADAAFFWRESSRDGVYNSGLNIARAGLAGGSRYVGSQAGTQIEWRLQRHLTWTANYSHFFAGRFLDENPPAEDVNYLSTWITFRF